MNIDKTKYKWIISDLDLIPKFHGDYSGIGNEATLSAAYIFLNKIEHEKIAVLSSDELFCVLEDAIAIDKGVFICLEKQYSINKDTYRPRIESDKPERMYDHRAEFEIKILDGDLFYILEKNVDSSVTI